MRTRKLFWISVLMILFCVMAFTGEAEAQIFLDDESMDRETQPLQITFDDRMLFANSQTKKAVDSSRAKLVGDIIYPNVDESKFSELFSDIGSRPNIQIRQYVSALVLKRMYRMSDEALIEFLRCGALNFQYALHTTQEERQPLSESSLRRFRRSLEAYEKEHGRDLVKEDHPHHRQCHHA